MQSDYSVSVVYQNDEFPKKHVFCTTYIPGCGLLAKAHLYFTITISPSHVSKTLAFPDPTLPLPPIATPPPP
jgi:hypothetical protein